MLPCGTTGASLPHLLSAQDRDPLPANPVPRSSRRVVCSSGRRPRRGASRERRSHGGVQTRNSARTECHGVPHRREAGPPRSLGSEERVAVRPGRTFLDPSPTCGRRSPQRSPSSACVGGPTADRTRSFSASALCLPIPLPRLLASRSRCPPGSSRRSWPSFPAVGTLRRALRLQARRGTTPPCSARRSPSPSYAPPHHPRGRPHRPRRRHPPAPRPRSRPRNPHLAAPVARRAPAPPARVVTRPKPVAVVAQPAVTPEAPAPLSHPPWWTRRRRRRRPRQHRRDPRPSRRRSSGLRLPATTHLALGGGERCEPAQSCRRRHPGPARSACPRSDPLRAAARRHLAGSP